QLNILKNRYSVLFSFIIVFLISSFFIRTGLLVASLMKTDLSFLAILKIYFTGTFFDLGVSFFIVASYALYLLLLPQKWNNSKFNRIATYIWLFLVVLIFMFSFFAEITFWQEFESRFNFIAVDYLIYTYEVINNINESYPLPILIGGILLLTSAVMFLFYRRKIFAASFYSNTPFSKRLLISGLLIGLAVVYGFFVSNSLADGSQNRYQNELSKAGVYSFFAAFKNNELNYNDFYPLIEKKLAYQVIRKELSEQGSTYVNEGNSVRRKIDNGNSPYRPNVIMITVESLSAEFLGSFGSKSNLTPVLDSLAKENVLFTNMYATGTRTVRGMEALSLCVPPTPGSSIVRRPGNEKLTTVGHIFQQAGYNRTFFYGGDGYFDNMNQYFGSNGFDIVDRGKKIMVGESYTTKRTIITDDQVKFENAWGISDEDLYDAVIRGSDQYYKEGRPFYNFVMTTSNHRPFTYPAGKINIPSGSGRDGAVRYTDYTIGEFLKKAKTKPWFKNTVIVIVADHCASSAGKNEIDISKYHIPCIIVNLQGAASKVIDQTCSQIDLYPTLFKLMGWNYESNLYGKNVLDPGYDSRIVLGTYQKLAYMKKDSLVILSPQQKIETYIYNKDTNEQLPAKFPEPIIQQAISNYQTAYDLFKNGGLHW
ncbi:LTA synthase family protein, partial [Pedobacter sp. HMWF019]|uniref:LTA synthase family protein n=1 Tax=Pedobacter sp. HMWF019 TaxID=2056856 RepID=UPI00351300F3